MNHEEIKVLMNMHDYDKHKQEVKVIDKYGPTNKTEFWVVRENGLVLFRKGDFCFIRYL